MRSHARRPLSQTSRTTSPSNDSTCKTDGGDYNTTKNVNKRSTIKIRYVDSKGLEHTAGLSYGEITGGSY
jgi:hypothetical protein